MLANGTIAAKDYLGITTESINKSGDGKSYKIWEVR